MDMHGICLGTYQGFTLSGTTESLAGPASSVILGCLPQYSFFPDWHSDFVVLLCKQEYRCRNRVDVAGSFGKLCVLSSRRFAGQPVSKGGDADAS